MTTVRPATQLYVLIDGLHVEHVCIRCLDERAAERDKRLIAMMTHPS